MGAVASPLVIGRYAIYGKIASGGMASVHFGRLMGAAGFSRTVAIKKLHAHLAEDPEFRSTMIDEARMAARIHHPNVVPTLDVVSADGELLVVMEYVRGESLSRVLKTERERGRRVPLATASAIVVGALHGLHAAHEAKSDRGAPLAIVHRDISPQNVLLGVDGMARIIDFGVAKAAGRIQTTREGVVKGKMAYMAPEQLAAGEVTRQADVYAMSVMLWEMLVGDRLFQGPSDAALVAKVMAGAQVPPSRHTPHVTPELDALVMTGLALDPGRRFASAREMAERLKSLVPPAFPTDVGAWVEEVAGDALAQRGSLLEEIESDSHMASIPPSERAVLAHSTVPTNVVDSGRPTERQLRSPTDDVASLASQPSVLSVRTPGPSVSRSSPGFSRARVISAVLSTLGTISLGIAILLWRGVLHHGPTDTAPQGGASSASESAPAAGPGPAVVSSSVASSSPTSNAEAAAVSSPASSGSSAAATPLPSASSAVSAAPSARSVPPPRSPTRPAPAKSAAPFKFTQPD